VKLRDSVFRLSLAKLDDYPRTTCYGILANMLAACQFMLAMYVSKTLNMLEMLITFVHFKYKSLSSQHQSSFIRFTHLFIFDILVFSSSPNYCTQ